MCKSDGDGGPGFRKPTTSLADPIILHRLVVAGVATRIALRILQEVPGKGIPRIANGVPVLLNTPQFR